MTDLIQKIFIPQTTFESANSSERLTKMFANLYRIELFKDGLDLILTKLQQGHLKFEVKLVKGWDTNVGCFLTQQQGFFDKALGKFFYKKELKIILRGISCNVLAHEMAHALEFESGLDLGEEFRKCIGYDMKDRNPNNVALKGEIKRLMVDALKSYPANQFISELFARYFELLSLSRNVQSNGNFTTAEVMEFFANTTNFLEKIFNPQIRKKINQQIASETVEIANQIKLEEPKEKFQERVNSFHQQKTFSGQKSWAKNTKSNAMWQEGWKKYQELEDKK